MGATNKPLFWSLLAPNWSMFLTISMLNLDEKGTNSLPSIHISLIMRFVWLSGETFGLSSKGRLWGWIEGRIEVERNLERAKGSGRKEARMCTKPHTHAVVAEPTHGQHYHHARLCVVTMCRARLAMGRGTVMGRGGFHDFKFIFNLF